MAYDSAKYPVNTPITGLDGSNNIVPLNIDGSGNLKTTGGGGGGGTQYTDGGTPPANPVAGAVMFDKAGVWTDVSVADPLPVTGGGGGTQYTDAGTPPANPVGTALVFDSAGTWKDVSLADGLPANVINGNANGQTTMSASAPVTIASDQLPLTTTTGTKSNVAASASSVTILASNASAKGRMVYNDSTAILYLDLTGGTASTTSYSVQVPAQGFFEIPGPAIYTGAITGIWSAVNGSARVTQFT